MQKTFNPVNYNWKWTEDWYEWDSKAAHKAALKARNAEAKQLRAEGKVVKCFSNPNQLISRGGIGSGNPHIEVIVNCYGFNVY